METMKNDLANISKELEGIKTVITQNVPVEEIYLFGSRAYGEPKADSDIDVIELNANIRYALYKKLSVPLDLLIAKKSVFERRSRGLTLESLIAKQGVRIYGN